MHSLGIAEVRFEDESRKFENSSRPLEVTIWYPTEKSSLTQKIEFGIWKIKEAARETAIFSGGKKLPLILFSHGYSANQWVNTWFTEYLAAQGFIVASVKHYGNSFKNMIPELCARPWNRPQDLSVVLDHLLLHPKFKDSIDENKIGTAGFSQGGMTSIWLGGAQASLSLENLREQITVIDHPDYRKAHFKDIPTQRLDTILQNFTQQDFTEANQSYRDERVKAAFSMAPGIDQKNKMFTSGGLSKVCIPTHIVIGESDTALIHDAQFFAQHIPNSAFTIIPGEVTHMTLLNEGTEQGKKSNPEYTCDHASINRAQIHRDIGGLAVDFFNKYL